MPTLYGRTQELITLTQAVQTCQVVLEEAIALLYAPSFCQLARIEAGQFKEVDPEHPVNEQVVSSEKLETIFEARVFNLKVELRWLNNLNGQGTAVLLADKEELIENYFKDKVNLPYLEILQQQYLLWGTGTQATLPNHWKRLTEARIGRLDLPLTVLKTEQRAYLHTQEYLAVGDYGNVSVVEERLLQIVNSDHKSVKHLGTKKDKN